MSFSISSSKPASDLTTFVIAGLLLLAGLFLASEWLVRSQVIPQDEFRAHALLLENSASQDAAFGDSHVARGFVPPKDMVNLAFPSETVTHMDWKIRSYFSDRKPGKIILPADPHMFSLYRLYAARPSNYGTALSEAGSVEQLPLAVAFSRFRAQLMNYWSSYFRSGGTLRSRIEMTPNGALLSPGNLSEEDPRRRAFLARDRVTQHKIGNGKLLDRDKELFSGMVEFLASKDAEVCLMTFPLSPDYLNEIQTRWTPKEIRDRNDILTYFEEAANRDNIRYVDFQNHFTDLALFRDVDHLNGQAAIKASEIMYDACFS